jgi:hypothetical protein
MRHLRMLGLCVVAALAVAAVAATGASALPEFGKCVHIGAKGGKYTDSNCTKKAAKNAAGEFLGEFEFKKVKELKEEGAHLGFKGASVSGGGVLTSDITRSCVKSSGGAVRVTRKKCHELEEKKEGEEVVNANEPPTKVACESESNSGEISGSKEVTKVAATFKGCKLFGSAPCSNTATEGEIVVNVLKGQLGYIDKATKDVGLLVFPANKGLFVKFVCAGFLAIEVGVGNKTEGAEYVKGPLYPNGCTDSCPGATPEEEAHGGYDGVISTITPVNQMTTKTTQVFTANERAENIPSHFAGKHIDLLEVSIFNTEEPAVKVDWNRAGEELTNENTAEEAGEIKA